MPIHRGAVVVLLLTMLFGLVPASAAFAATVDVEATDFEFIPDVAPIAVGDTVTWTNTGDAPHTVTADDGAFDHWLDPGDTVSITFTEDEWVSYFCELHGAPGGLGMAGAVQVGDAEPPPPPDTTPLVADSNVAAALAWSKRNFADGEAEVALLGRDDVFADSLASGAVQGLLGAPLLLTPSDQLAPAVRDELNRLGVNTVYVLGGTVAIHDSVVGALQAEGYTVERVSGPNRMATAVEIARKFFGQAGTAILARAFGTENDPTRAFADSLAAGAFAARTGQPILLSQTEALSAEPASYLQGSNISEVTLVGGTLALSPQVEADVQARGIDTDRVSGPNRFATAVQLLFAAGPAPVMTVIDGMHPEAWAAGFPAASAGYPVVLTEGNELAQETLHVLVDFGSLGVAELCGPFLSAHACGRAATATSATGFFGPDSKFFILEGRQEVPGPGDPDASGIGAVFSTADPGTICYDYELFSLESAPTAAHIHSGATGVSGPPVITLTSDLSRSPEPERIVSCSFDQDPNVVQAVLSSHAGYYVNVHNEPHPDGAIRGQLFELQGLAETEMSGDQEAAGGDPTGFGFAVMIFNEEPDEVCMLMFLGPLSSPVTASHIHQGPVGESGPPVVTLRPPAAPGGTAGCYEVAPELRQDLQANSGDYYVNVHTEAYPAGAIRGQLG